MWRRDRSPIQPAVPWGWKIHPFPSSLPVAPLCPAVLCILIPTRCLVWWVLWVPTGHFLPATPFGSRMLARRINCCASWGVLPVDVMLPLGFVWSLSHWRKMLSVMCRESHEAQGMLLPYFGDGCGNIHPWQLSWTEHEKGWERWDLNSVNWQALEGLRCSERPEPRQSPMQCAQYVAYSLLKPPLLCAFPGKMEYVSLHKMCTLSGIVWSGFLGSSLCISWNNSCAECTLGSLVPPDHSLLSGS